MKNKEQFNDGVRLCKPSEFINDPTFIKYPRYFRLLNPALLCVVKLFVTRYTKRNPIAQISKIFSGLISPFKLTNFFITKLTKERLSFVSIHPTMKSVVPYLIALPVAVF